MYQIYVYVPNNFIDVIKQTIFDSGGGVMNSYSDCCWQSPGTGQCKASQKNTPFIGEKNKIEVFEETKLESFCHTIEQAKKIVLAIKEKHPYESPVIGVVKLENIMI